MRKHALSIGLVVASAGIAAVAVLYFLAAWLQVPPDRATCFDSTQGVSVTESTPKELHACFVKQGETFVKTDYAESKDLSKAFLSLLTAVFVASITFSEKIVGIGNSGWWAKSLMILCWSLLLLAIVACGAALALMTIAAGWATHNSSLNFWLFEYRAMSLFLTAGIFFGGGLTAMLVTGVISLLHTRQAPAPDVAQPSAAGDAPQAARP